MALRLHLITLRVEGCGSFLKIGYYSVNCARTFFATIICVRKIFWQNHMVKLYVHRCLQTTHNVSSIFSYLKKAVRTSLQKENTDLPLLPFYSRHPYNHHHHLLRLTCILMIVCGFRPAHDFLMKPPQLSCRLQHVQDIQL